MRNLVTQRGLLERDCCLRRWLDFGRGDSWANKQQSREGNGAGKGAIPEINKTKRKGYVRHLQGQVRLGRLLVWVS